MTGDVFSILRCTECGIEQTLPALADLGPYYADYYGGRHGFTERHCVHRRLRWTNSFKKGQHPRLLDIGCGEGTFLLAARATGWQVAGTEMNPGPARAHGLDVRSSLEEVGTLAPFDCITLWHSLEHMRDPRIAIAKAHQLLPLGGALLIAVPDARGWQARLFGRNWLHRDVPRHLYHFSESSIRGLLERESFSVVRAWHQEFEYDLLGWSQSALNALSRTPNVFFGALTGRKPKVSRLVTWMNVFGGIVFSGIALPLVPLSALARKGGTLVLAAEKV